MSGQFAHIARCMDLRDHDVNVAIGSREATIALLTHLGAVCAPNTGAAKALLVFARMATSACSWIDGDLCIELLGDGGATVVETATQLGGGMRERLLPPMRFHAPVGEFARAIERVPHMVAPLFIRARSSQGISLSASDLVRRTTAPPPPVEISSESLFVRAISPGVPREMDDLPTGLSNELDSGWDD
jgi:hypothetical protein